MRRFATILQVVVLAVSCPLAELRADDPVYSGPQVGERLSPFQVRGVLGDDVGKSIDFVSETKGKPVVLIFIHDATRPSLGFTRTLSAYTATRATDGLVTGIVWLDADATAGENAVKRVKHALTPGVRIGVSDEGQEGPGSYGLNRNVMLTILLGKDDKVTANFALVQPSIQADLPKVLQKVVDLVGGTVPKLSELPGVEGARMRGAETDDRLPNLLRPVIQRDATVEQVDKAAQIVEEYVAKNKAAAAEVGRIAKTIVGGGKLSNYGTPRAQEVLRRWAETYGAEIVSKEASTDSKPAKPLEPKSSRDDK